jgi:hypothetical protein
MITREQFLAYERVRRMGVVNMFDVKVVCQLSGLRREEAIEIMRSYEKLMKEYLTELKEAK